MFWNAWGHSNVGQCSEKTIPDHILMPTTDANTALPASDLTYFIRCLPYKLERCPSMQHKQCAPLWILLYVSIQVYVGPTAIRYLVCNAVALPNNAESIDAVAFSYAIRKFGILYTHCGRTETCNRENINTGPIARLTFSS